MSGNLAATLKLARQGREAAEPEPTPTATPEPTAMPAPEATKPAQKGRGGKISDPDFQRLGILIRRSYLKKIQRHLLDAEGDISDYIDKVLEHATMRMGE